MGEKKLIPAIAALVTAGLFPQQGAARENVVIIVNADNEIALDEIETRRLLRRLYLKERTAWPNGEKALFFARPSESDEESCFRNSVLEMNTTSLEDHWIRQKQIKGETPPRAISSTRILLRQIQTRANAVGVVSRSEYEQFAVGIDNIRVLLELEETPGDE